MSLSKPLRSTPTLPWKFTTNRQLQYWIDVTYHELSSQVQNSYKSVLNDFFAQHDSFDSVTVAEYLWNARMKRDKKPLSCTQASNLVSAYNLVGAIRDNEEVNQRLARIIKTYKSMTPPGTASRGAITRAMMEQLVTHLRKTKVATLEECFAIKLILSLGIRPNQISLLRRDHITKVEAADYPHFTFVFELPAQKKKSSSRRIAMEAHTLATDFAEEFELYKDVDYPEVQVFFPNFDHNKMSLVINQATKEIPDWPSEGMKFDGMHSLRHGAAAEAMEEGGVDAVILRTSHTSKTQPLLYGESNDVRPLRTAQRIEARAQADKRLEGYREYVVAEENKIVEERPLKYHVEVVNPMSKANEVMNLMKSSQSQRKVVRLNTTKKTHTTASVSPLGISMNVSRQRIGSTSNVTGMSASGKMTVAATEYVLG